MPSLYETTAAVGDVSSSNFTTLYNSSGLSAPNTGGGAVGGNLNVAGNLTVQGTSLLQGAVTLGSTLSLPNYTFPSPDGSTDQVLVTDGSGNLYWTDVSAIPGAAYSISATTATGGANLTLADSAGGTDSVKFAGGTNITVSRTDANTITISTVADNIPDGTANGQLLVWENSAWTASNNIVSDTSSGRFTATYKNSDAGVNSGVFARKDYGASTYTTGDGVAYAFQLDSDSQATNQIATIATTWNASAPTISLNTNINNNTTGPFASAASFSTAQATLPGDLAVNGGDVTTTATNASLFNSNATTVYAFGAATTVALGNASGIVYTEGDLQVQGGDITTPQVTGNLFNTNATTVNIGNAATIEVNLGNAGAGRVQVKSPTIVGANSTQAVFNTVATTVNAFGAATAINMGASTGTTTIGHDLTVNGGNININGTAVAATQPFLTFATQPNGVNPMYGIRGKSALNDPWFVGSGSVGLDQGYLELATGDNAGGTNDGGQIYVRQYNGYASGGVPWEGGSGTIVNELILLDASGNTSIPNNLAVDTNTLFVDAATGRVGVGTNTPSYTLDVQGDVGISGDIYVSGVHVDLTTPVHQGQLLYVSDDVTPTITNSSLVTFGSLTYRPTFEAKTGIYGRTQSGTGVISNTGAVPFTTGDGSSITLAVDSDSQSLTSIGSVSTAYNTSGDHEIRLTTSTNNFANDQATSITGSNTLVFPTVHGFSIGDKLIYSSPTQNGLTYNTTYYVISTGFTTTQCQVSTTLGGSAVALTNGTGLSLWFYNGIKRLISASAADIAIQAPTILLNATNTGIPFTGTAGLEVERGTNGANQTFAWDETYAFWRVSSDLYADNSVIGGVSLGTNGNNIYFNNENTAPAGDCFLSVQSGVSAGVAAKIKWDDTAKRWQDTTDGSTYYNLPNQNLDTTSDVAFSQVTIDNVATINTQSTTTTSTSTTSISATTRLSQKAVIRIVDNVTGEVHMLEALAFYKGTTAYLTTYAEMYTSAALATFTADVSGGAIRILATPASTNSTTFTVARTSLS